jgi:hypothetical protein
MCSDPGKARRAFDSAWNKFFPTPTPAHLNFNSSPLITKEFLRPTPSASPTPWTCPHPVKAKFDIELCWTQVESNDGFYMQTAPVSPDQWKRVMGYDPPPSDYSSSSLSNIRHNFFCVDAACVSTSAAHKFVTKLNQMDTEYSYDIPKEHEWNEWEKMAGAKARDFFGQFRVTARRRNTLYKF